ncbi:Phytoene synthase [gamma proteobacterium IMCC2047]|nr:Phytoene synthase [gamma proteobacterium IMCC2047]
MTAIATLSHKVRQTLLHGLAAGQLGDQLELGNVVMPASAANPADPQIS